MIARPSGPYWIVIGEGVADGGRIVAQGSQLLCERVVAGLPLVTHQGDLFE